MDRATSLYLDAVRFVAAVVVLLTHLAYPRFSGGRLHEWRSFGNDAVMVFFVLSGCVIAHTAAHRDRDLATFATNRVARLWSVALPAIALTLVLDFAGRRLDPAFYDGPWFQASAPFVRVLTAATFTGELWFGSWRLFSNGPYWSLGYEFWYYALFAAAWYLRGRRRTAAVLAIALIVGPKILLLAPVWWLGVWVWRRNERPRLAPRAGLALWVATIAAYAAFRAGGGPELLLDWTHARLGARSDALRWSSEFLSSFVIGPLVALNFVGFRAASATFEPLLARFERPIRAWAGVTFSIYLFHLPILQFLGAALPLDRRSPLAILALFAATLLGCRLLGAFTEQRKEAARAAVRAAVTGLSGLARRRRRIPVAVDERERG